MAGRIPNLWPADKVSVSALSPVAILRAQGQYLLEQTQGMIGGEVITKEVESNSGQNVRTSATYHSFEIVALTITGHRHRILKIRQDTALPYPVYHSEAPEEARSALGFSPNAALLQVNTETEFVALLTSVFRSGPVLSLINSLIAQINEARAGAEGELH